MRRPPPPHPRGAPRTPGSGRRRGTPNRRTIAMKELMAALCGDVDYQSRLRADFRHRRIHPTIEALVWAHAVGKPTEQVQLSADGPMNQTLDQERELFRQLDLPQLESLAVESQALLDRAMAMVKANALAPVPVAARPAPVEGGENDKRPTEKSTGTNVDDE